MKGGHLAIVAGMKNPYESNCKVAKVAMMGILRHHLIVLTDGTSSGLMRITSNEAGIQVAVMRVVSSCLRFKKNRTWREVQSSFRAWG
jgi:hypothetical protein